MHALATSHHWERLQADAVQHLGRLAVEPERGGRERREYRGRTADGHDPVAGVACRGGSAGRIGNRDANEKAL